uniref:Vesicle transport protein USE1 n=1 Tax=Macaca mulatta TaxID=9544 RepID=A0A5F8ALE3_MACMU
MAASRLELNLVRLLSRCEAMAAEKRDPDEWRLEKYVGALEDMLQALKVHASKPASEVINEYSWKVDFLKGMLQAEKLVRRGAPPPQPPSPLTFVPRTCPSSDFSSHISADLLLRESTGQPVPGPWPCANHSQRASARHKDGASAVTGAVHQRDAE